MELTVDKNNYILSKRYALALIELSSNNEMLEAYYNDLLNVLDAYKNSESLKEMADLPSVDKDKKKEVIKNIFKGKINETVLKFLYVLVDSNRFQNIETIIYCFKQEKDKIKNIINADIVSSTDFRQDMKIKLQRVLENKTNKKVNITYKKDESLIAGFILTIDEHVVDLSLKNKIKQIEKQLI